MTGFWCERVFGRDRCWNITLWFRCVRGALFQTISVRAASFAGIDVTVRIKVDMSRRPLRGDVDAMVPSLVTPPIELHKEGFIWDYVAIAQRRFAGVQPAATTSVNPILCIPDCPEFFCSFL